MVDLHSQEQEDELQSTQEKLTRVQRELQSTQEELNRLRTEKENRVNRFTQTQKELSESQSTVDDQGRIIQNLEIEKQELLNTIQPLETEITRLQDEKRLIESNLEELKNQLATTQNELTQMSQCVTELENQVDSQNIKISQMTKEKEKLQADIKQLSTTLRTFVKASKELLMAGVLESFPNMRELVLIAAPECHILDIVREEGIIELTHVQDKLKESRETVEQLVAELTSEGLIQRAGDYILHFKFDPQEIDLPKMTPMALFDYSMLRVAQVGGEVEKTQEILLELQETLSRRFQNPIIYELLMYASAGDLSDISKVISDLKTWRQRISELNST
ncbi:MAG: hypothetical protein ACFFDT_07285 [Candidatus Hodarchaeota archaeon]